MPLMKKKKTKAEDSSTPEVRRALTGLGLLQGQSLAAAMRGAGLSASTASNPRQNGYVAEQCIELARALFPETDPSYLRTLARRASALKMAKIVADPKALDFTRLSELSRMLDTVEKHHGANAGGTTEGEAREFVDRLELMQEIAAEIHRRKTMAPLIPSVPVTIRSETESE
jgi:hypothetical protein